MAIFNFFSSKSSSSSTPNQENLIVAFDIDALESKNVNWDFLNSFENPELWIFTSNKENQKLKEMEQKFLVKTFPLPEDTRQSPFWVLGIVMYELHSIKDPYKITLVATLPYYEAISEYLKLKSIPIEFLLLEAQINKLPKVPITTKTSSQNAAAENKNAADKKKSENAEKKTPKSRKKREPIIQKLDQEELQKICNAFQEHFELEGIYEKKALGEIVLVATGKTVQKVFHTRNAKLYVGCLYQNGIIENINENDFKLLKYPTPEIFPQEVKVLPKKIRRNKRSKKK
ncbi:MAG: hypothetical protein KatS3mg035_1572 [Bacteroidia bacterium]|nr:MAG: hypothetical protein KatS3mg035_1572 [Bacteroidia bacterium]